MYLQIIDICAPIMSSKARSQKQVCDHFGQILENKEFSDLEIECDWKDFHCHQSILAARSPVLKAMIQDGKEKPLKAKQLLKIEVDDVDQEVFAEMLTFIYTGDLKKEKVLTEKASELLEAADMYQLDLLKEVWEEKLCSILNVKNSVEFLVLGDLYQAPKLKNMALSLLRTKKSKIEDSNVYKNLFSRRQDLEVNNNR